MSESDRPWFLVSLYHKEPYEGWIRDVGETGRFRFLGTGGTASWCEQQGVPCETLSEVIGLQPRLGGKVKSLHPDLYTGIMASSPQEVPDSVPYIGGVFVDLTPFEQDGAFRPGKIDIGGPSLLRAAAKSWETVVVVSGPDSAEFHRNHLDPAEEERRHLAGLTLERTLRYDKDLLTRFDGDLEEFTLSRNLSLPSVQPLRYGENPSQSASLSRDLFGYSSPPFERLCGDALSYTNVLDTVAARRLCPPDSAAQVSVIKHTNPTGWARGEDPVDVFHRAWEGDPKSAFGSVVALNGTVTEPFVAALEEYFVVGLVAPEFESAAVDRLAEQGSTRALRWDRNWRDRTAESVRSAAGVYLVQDNSPGVEDPEQWTVAGSVQPTDEEHRALRQMWRIGRWVTSNAAVIGSPDRVLGVGAGQQSRVDAVSLAVRKVHEHHGDPEGPLVLASDGFFPFPDNVEEAARADVGAIVSPGGSVRDEEVLAAAEELGIAMVFTGTRAFYH